MRIEIVEARLSHVSAVASRLRAEERVEMAAAGETARHLMHRLWRDGTYRRAALIDGAPVAVWGCGGSFASPIADVWLFTTEVCDKIPFRFVRVVRAEIAEMLKTRHMIVSACLETCERSMRLWQMLGFEAKDPVDVGGNNRFHTLVLKRG